MEGSNERLYQIVRCSSLEDYNRMEFYDKKTVTRETIPKDEVNWRDEENKVSSHNSKTLNDTFIEVTS